ncbi:MAG: cell division protein SepF [Actinobacteria bacterium]|nr:cell division protein SepF [Actinomycetota bacterium]
MGFLDSMKSRLGFGGGDTWEEDYDEYEESREYDDDFDDGSRRRAPQQLQGSQRAQVHTGTDTSVKLVSRSERQRSASDYGSRFGRETGYDTNEFSPASYNEPDFLKNRGEAPSVASMRRTGSSYGVSSLVPLDGARSVRSTSSYDSAGSRSSSDASRSSHTASSLTIVAPTSYNEAEKVARAFKTGSPVALSLVNARPELAKRILDFSFGVASALGGRVEKIADKVFLLTYNPSGLTESERKQLSDAGILP